MRKLICMLTTIAMLLSICIVPAYADTGEVSFNRILNAHDIGGWKTADGRHVRKGVILHTGELAYATSADIAKLKNVYHIKRVYDFRYPVDHKYCPDKAIPGATNVNLPTKYKKSHSKRIPKKRYKKFKKYGNAKLRKKMIPTFKKMNRSYTYDLVMSSYSQKQYKKYFDYLLVNNPNNGVLFHCIHGKDRTGVAAFMTLIALGVSENDAYSEFTGTNVWLNKYGHSTYKKGKIGVRKSDLQYAVSKAKKKYGSLNKFLEKAYGLDQNDLNKLRNKYLV